MKIINMLLRDVKQILTGFSHEFEQESGLTVTESTVRLSEKSMGGVA